MKHAFKFFCVVLLLAMLAACAPAAVQPTAQPTKPAAVEATKPPSSGSSSSDTLRVWITWGDNPAQLQELFNQYGKANNVKVEVNAPVETDKVVAALSGTEPPDLLVLSGPGDVGKYAQENLIVPLDDALAANSVNMSDFVEAPLATCKMLGKYYCVPWGTDTYALYWNKDLFEQAGLDPEKPPQTMEQLVEYADKLTKKNSSGELTQVGFIPNFAWGHTDLYLRMFGGWYYNKDMNKVTIDTPEMLAALKWQQQFYTKYGSANVLKLMSAGNNYSSPDQGFYAGTIAMYVDGEWQPSMNFIQKFKPELNYGVAPFPYPSSNPERKNTNSVGGTVVVIPAAAKDKAASAKLLAWLTSPDIVTEQFTQSFNLPTSKKSAQDPKWHENKKFEVFLTLLNDPNAQGYTMSLIQSEVDTELGQIEEKVFNGEDPAPLLAAAQTKLQALLDKALTK